MDWTWTDKKPTLQGLSLRVSEGSVQFAKAEKQLIDNATQQGILWTNNQHGKI